MALAINLPGDGCVLRAHLVATRLSGGRSGVNVDVLAHFLVNDHATNHVRVEVRLIVDDGEDLTVDANGARDILRAKCQKGLEGEVTEDSIVERGLILVDCAAGASGGVGPVHLISLADLHVLAMLPVVRRGELGIVGVVVFAAETVLDFCMFLVSSRRCEVAIGPRRSRDVAVRTIASLVVLSNGVVLGSQVPVHVHRAHGALPVGLGVRH